MFFKIKFVFHLSYAALKTGREWTEYFISLWARFVNSQTDTFSSNGIRVRHSVQFKLKGITVMHRIILYHFFLFSNRKINLPVQIIKQSWKIVWLLQKLFVLFIIYIIKAKNLAKFIKSIYSKIMYV